MQLSSSATLNDLKSDIYFKAKITANTFNANDINRIINIYYKIVQEDIRATNEDFFLVSAKADLQLFSNNQGVYTYPTDMEKIKSFWVAMQPLNSATPLYTEYIRCQVIDANAITDPSYAFSNPTIINFGTYFSLMPQLIDTKIYPVTGGMKIYYIPVQADLVNSTDTPLIPADYHDVITWGALIDISARMGKPELRTQAVKMFKERREAMKRDIAGRILNNESSYVEGQGSNGGWAFPFGNSSGI